MTFLSNLFNKFKGGNNQQMEQVQQPAPQAANPIMAGVEQAINTNPAQSMPQDNNTAPQNGANKIVNALKNISPANWDDTTRQRVLMTSQFLTGFGGTPYDPNSNFMGNLARGVANGSNAAYKQIQNYGNYQQVKNMYEQMGYDTSGLSPLGDYSKLAPSVLLNAGAKMKQNEIKKEIQNAKDKTTKTKLIIDAVNKGIMTPEEGQLQLKALDFDTTLQESNDTKRTNSQVKVNDARITKIKADIQQNAQKIKILQQKVALNKASQGDKDELRRLNIENKKLIIEQNKLINKAMEDQLGGGGGGVTVNAGGGKARPLGQKGDGYAF